MNTQIESIALDDEALENVDGAWIGPAIRGAKLAYEAVKVVARSPYGKGVMTGWGLSDLFSGSSSEKDTNAKAVLA